MKNRRIYALLTLMLLSATLSAQVQQKEQKGIVKTRGRMVNGQLQPGVGLSGATVILGDRNVLSRDGEDAQRGMFSFPVKDGRYLVKDVVKKGYQLVDREMCHDYHYSSDLLFLVLETPEQQRADELAKERRLRRDLEQRLRQCEDEVESLNVSLEEKNRLLQEINRERDDNEKIIRDLSRYYATLDYDQLSDFQAKVSYLLENGQLEQADSMLRTRGSMEERIRSIQYEQEAEAEEEAELAQRQEDLATSKEGTRKRMEEAAADCYSFHQRFIQDHQRDSAAHYLELRAALDTTNVEWQNEAGRYNKDYMADYAKALRYCNIVLRQSLHQFGEESEWTATAYNNIGMVYSNQGDHAKALEHLGKSLTIFEKVLGLEHPIVATIYNNIGTVYSEQGDYSKALEQYGKALAIFENELGLDHPEVANAYNNIGTVYSEQGDYSKALTYFGKALAIQEKVLDLEHLSVATIYGNIGRIYSDQGDYSNALDYFGRALAIKEQVLGLEHPDVATTCGYIGLVYYSQGDYAKALEYYNKSLAIREKVLGQEHPDVANAYNNIGFIYSDQGDYSNALEYYGKALAIFEKVLDPKHPNVATTYNNIGLVYHYQSDYANALEHYGKALAIREKVLGMEHPDAKETRSNIIYAKYYLALSENSLPEFLSNHVFTATVAEGDTPALQQGMSGEYILLEFADWTQESPTSLFDKLAEGRGKPKDIVVWKDGIISRHHFEDSIGAINTIKQVTEEERQRINEAYEKWKKQ